MKPDVKRMRNLELAKADLMDCINGNCVKVEVQSGQKTAKVKR